MKLIFVLIVLVGACSAQQQRYTASQSTNDIVITRSEQENNGDGSFRWASELSNGNKHEQSGYLKAGPDPEKPIQVIQGVISYISPEGQQIDLSYIADENGFQPQGAHIPRLPAQNVQPQQQRPQQYQQQPQQYQQQPQQYQQQRNQYQQPQQYRRRPQSN